MEPNSTASIKIARWYLTAIVALNLYRAMTQSVTPGEAWNFDRFIGPAWNEALSRYDVNNHVLNTLLVRISTARFHLTELSLRLPSLLAGLMYLWVAFRLSRRWFGDGLAFLAVLGLLTLNPVVIDALSEARGYGMAMAGWMWALALMLESSQAFSPPKLRAASLLLALSSTASLAFLAPACALLLVCLVWLRGVPEAAGRRLSLVPIFVLTLFVVLVIPLNHAEWKTLGVGATSLRQAINEITALSIGTSAKGVVAAARALLGLAAIAGAIAAIGSWRRRGDEMLAMTGATLGLTLLLVLGAHRWLHTPFPQEGFIYVIPIAVLSLAYAFLKKNNMPAQIVFVCLAGLLLVRYATLFPYGAYASGASFADARTLAKVLRQKAGNRTVRVGASLSAEPILNYYRVRYRQGNWEPIERKPLGAEYDYYVLTPGDAAVLEERHLHVLYRDSGLTLAQ